MDTLRCGSLDILRSPRLPGGAAAAAAAAAAAVVVVAVADPDAALLTSLMDVLFLIALGGGCEDCAVGTAVGAGRTTLS